MLCVTFTHLAYLKFGVILLEFGLFKDHVLTYFRIVLLKLQFTGASATVLACGIEVTSTSGALELDFFALWLSHDRLRSECGASEMTSSDV